MTGNRLIVFALYLLRDSYFNVKKVLDEHGSPNVADRVIELYEDWQRTGKPAVTEFQFAGESAQAYADANFPFGHKQHQRHRTACLAVCHIAWAATGEQNHVEIRRAARDASLSQAKLCQAADYYDDIFGKLLDVVIR